MGVAVELVDGITFASEASRILEEAWLPPALSYTPEYLAWQFAFPSPIPCPAVAAFSGTEPAGFAGVTARRLRSGGQCWHSGIVSFVAVRPAWRGQGIAAALYAHLLAELRRNGMTVITFASADTPGERTLLRAYPEAGFRMHPLGAYPVYGCLPRSAPAQSGWRAMPTTDTASLSSIVEACADADGSVIWNDPDPHQLEHYCRDPRPRRLILLERGDGLRGAAWAIQSAFRTARGADTVTTLESIWLPRTEAGALPVLFHAAASLWPSTAPAVVNAPSLAGFGSAALRAAGIRQTGARYLGFLGTASPEGSVLAEYTNLDGV